MLRMDSDRTIVESMVILIESKDQITGTHSRNTSKYVRILVEELQKCDTFHITDTFSNSIISAAPLHDIGKVAIPDNVLKKEGKYTAEEFECMKRHTILGRDILEKEIKLFPELVCLKEAKVLAEYHHEKWNGTGYPHRLKGEEIPVSARIMAVADVFDALTAKRQYKDAFDFEKSVQIIKDGFGTHFDPEIVQAFLNAKDRFYLELIKTKK